MDDSWKPNYEVRPTSAVIRQGKHLSISRKEFLRVTRQLRRLQYWPLSGEEFEFEMVSESIEIKFNLKDHWLRVFAHKDETNKIIWIHQTFEKKTNKLTTHDLNRVKHSEKVLKFEITAETERQEKLAQKKKTGMTVINGGRK